MGRRVISKVQLGNGQVLYGETIRRYKSVKNKPLVYVAGQFADGALKAVDVRGKIVLCDRTEDPVMRGEMIRTAGGVGMISMSGLKRGGATTPLDNFTIAASRVHHDDGETMKAYVNSTANPTASLHFAGVVLNPSSQPAIAEYSSRGPCNMSNIGVMKPDITGPGTNIVAAVPGSPPGGNSSAHTRTFGIHSGTNIVAGLAAIPVSPPGGNSSARTRTFGIHSGTSMSTPHLAGIAAVLKRAHPEWSPAAIKSAMMTTADVTHPDGTAITDETTGRPAGEPLRYGRRARQPDESP